MFRTLVSCRQYICRRSLTTRPHVVYDDQTNSFLSVFPDVLDAIFTSRFVVDAPQYKDHFVKVIKYNAIKEKRFRVPLLLDSYKILEKPENLTERNLHLMNIIAWVIEIIQAYMYAEDDTMDQSPNRCDDICWHRMENIGLSSFRDFLFLYEASFTLIRKYFYDTPMYIPLIDLFHDMNQHLVIGQSLDWHAKTKVDFSKFTPYLYSTTGQNKGGFTIIETPFRASCILSNSYSKYIKVKELIHKINYAFQVDNDVLDVFQNGTAKIDAGENIRQGQCTWMAVEVIQNGSESIKKLFKENYGRAGKEYENKIINIYYELGLYDKYLKYKKDTIEYIKDSANMIDDVPLRNAILNLCNIIYI